MNHLEQVISNYINGNISAAKAGARRYSEITISKALADDFGYSWKKAALTAAHMKGADCWQAACDAK